MNNNNRGNNNNNNRRRSRGNSRPQGVGGGSGSGQQTNRIDSRARGNAPQMLEKYRKLAQDAHLNGDRVNSEYYLQFADHYFRVIADTRVRLEESRVRRDDRWGENGETGAREESEENGEFSVEADFPAFDQLPVYTRRDREDRPAERAPERAPERTNERAPERSPERSPERTSEYRRRDERPSRDENPRDDTPRADGGNFASAPDQGASEEAPREPASIYEPSENPFVRPSRGPRAVRPNRDERPRRDIPRRENTGDERPLGARPTAARPRDESAEPTSVGLDPSLLPPAISATRRDNEGTSDAPANTDSEATPRRRIRRKPVDDAGDTLDVLG